MHIEAGDFIVCPLNKHFKSRSCELISYFTDHKQPIKCKISVEGATIGAKIAPQHQGEVERKKNQLKIQRNTKKNKPATTN